MTNRKLVAATRNKGKIRELESLLAGLPFNICGLAEFGIDLDVEETGETFIENASLKASEYAKLTRELTLSDDSGLVVDALGGAPGVYSARYAGENAGDDERIAKLLGELSAIPAADRTARFVCAIAVADEHGSIIESVEGFCEGSIAFEPRGSHGFGYDPIFVPNGFDASFGELSDTIKSQISHRAAATSMIMRFFRDFCGSQT